MDEPSPFDDVAHVIKSCGIAGFEYRDFNAAADRLPPAENIDENRVEKEDLQYLEAAKKSTVLSTMFKILSTAS